MESNPLLASSPAAGIRRQRTRARNDVPPNRWFPCSNMALEGGMEEKDGGEAWGGGSSREFHVHASIWRVNSVDSRTEKLCSPEYGPPRCSAANLLETATAIDWLDLPFGNSPRMNKTNLPPQPENDTQKGFCAKDSAPARK